uniref:Snake toxin/toxin-like domain-containing protein n=1 Tax=Salarias fasciatus TaxID=181472 RepID=A0A672J2F4_SALFA
SEPKHGCLLFLLPGAFASAGRSLQCYSCPDGSSSGCEVKQECSQGEDSCLKLTSGGKSASSSVPLQQKRNSFSIYITGSL